MPLGQALNSVRRILSNPNVSPLPALGRYVRWQGRRMVNAFPVELRLSRSVIVARSGRCGVSALVNAHGLYDYNNMLLIQLMLADGGTFVDVGANVGAFTLVAAEQPAARVLAIEPHPATYATLAANVERNGYRNVALVRAAAGACEGMVTITDTPGSSTTHIVHEGEGLPVPVHRVDGLLAIHALAPDLVKVDVEGFELDVLRGFGERLPEVRLLFIEINGLADRRGLGSAALLEFLSKAGFDGPFHCDFQRRRLEDREVLAGEDSLFVNQRFMAEFSRRHGFHRP